jgi:benzoate membrane transport protein
MPNSPAPSEAKTTRARIDSRPVVAGIVTALVGFTSSFAVVLAGLKAVGADSAQAASGLLALTLSVGFGVLVLAWRTRR